MTPQLPEDVRALYPWGGKRFALPAGPELHYLDEGTGPVVLMVHGNPTWSFYYRSLVADLSKDHRCVVPDHLGMGLSDKPDDFEYTIQAHIDHLVALIDHLDLHDVTLVVHDWGGPIGFGAAIARPDRFKRFVVFNTSLFHGPLPKSIALCRVPALGPVLVQGLNGFVRVSLVRAIADRSRIAGPVGRGYLAPYDSWAHRKAQQAFVEAIPMKPSHPNWDLIAHIDRDSGVFGSRPMMMVWGEQDFCFTPWFRKGMEARFPEAEVHALDDASHYVVEDAHERILPLIRDFLARHPLDA